MLFRSRSEGTVAADLAKAPIIGDNAPLTPERTPSPPGRGGELAKTNGETEVVIAHGKGSIRVGIMMALDESGEKRVGSCVVSRTARRLFEGKVRYYV